MGLDVEFERCHEGQDESEEELKCEEHVGSFAWERSCFEDGGAGDCEMCCCCAVMFRTRC